MHILDTVSRMYKHLMKSTASHARSHRSFVPQRLKQGNLGPFSSKWRYPPTIVRHNGTMVCIHSLRKTEWLVSYTAFFSIWKQILILPLHIQLDSYHGSLICAWSSSYTFYAPEKRTILFHSTVDPSFILQLCRKLFHTQQIVYDLIWFLIL